MVINRMATLKSSTASDGRMLEKLIAITLRNRVALMAYETKPMKVGAHRVVLEEHPEGVYIFAFEGPDSKYPEKDYLQDNLAMAMEVCEEDYAVAKTSWVKIPDIGMR